ncbi:HD domain-containing protein [Aeoliella mucimassa]|uniref:HD domain protein n=1 Tax=Aeoliella mucimassa TaxID=2527972 RepID=A0A518AR23_9BACT|nr:HD domain-containing protein [Aeoliella mucimassa]QDU57168.1 HD domain protein [Aeoliella mucimassa]
MPHPYAAIPEFAERYSTSGLMRMPPCDDIPLTPRVRRLIDTPAFQRLKQVSQLGLVRMVYPGAGHSRFEHSLGTYRTALQFLERLSGDDRFTAAVSSRQAELFLLAALLHDVGHWPYCHPLEDIAAEGVVVHEQLARQAITTGPLAEALADDWQVDPAEVADLIAGSTTSTGDEIVASMLSGPIDVDKIDYLARDSRHCGVPYGQNFDQSRLVASLCLNEAGNRIAVTDKGKTAAELMVFARYVMFSEVYWHHAVRSSTAMLQRAVFDVTDRLDWAYLFASSDAQFAEHLRQHTTNIPASALVESLFGTQRSLFKRLAQYSYLDSPELHTKLARQPYAWLVERSSQLAECLTKQLGIDVAPHEVLIDAPPTKLEVQFNVDVCYTKRDAYRPLGEVSPVVRTLAREQFDNYVKQVRVFVAPRVAQAARGVDIDRLLDEVTS